MKPELTPEEIARRFADIDSRPPETLTPEKSTAANWSCAFPAVSIKP